MRLLLRGGAVREEKMPQKRGQRLSQAIKSRRRGQSGSSLKSSDWYASSVSAVSIARNLSDRVRGDSGEEKV